MDLQIYIDCSTYSDIGLEDILESVLEDLGSWIENKSSVKLLDVRPASSPEDWLLGYQLSVKSKFKLKDPLNHLYGMAKKYKCEFVVAEYDAKHDVAEPVCYFGFEEGKPDLFEMANYLGL